MIQNTNSIYHSPILTSLGVFHGYSSRLHGDMRVSEQKTAFFSALGIQMKDVVFSQQVHGSAVSGVCDNNFGSIIGRVDGLVYKNQKGEKSRILGVHTADCIPILAIDAKAGIAGVAHAGWKGTLGGVGRELIIAMKKLGAKTSDIHVSIGPHIGMCCYTIKKDRAEAFQKEFGRNIKMAANIDGEWHLNIGFANYKTLIELGIPKDHIDLSSVCTSCLVKKYYSYRKDTKETFGEQIGFIGFMK